MRCLLSLSFSSAVALTLLAACGDGGEASGPGAGGTGGTDDPAPKCPAGSHEHASGSCVSTLGAWSSAPLLTEARDHHLTFVVETNGGAYLYVAGGAAHAETAVTSIERATLGADGAPGAWETLPVAHEIVGGGVVVVGEKALFTAGYRGPSVSTQTDLVAVADDGSLSLQPGPELATPRFHHGTIRSGNFVYVTGGFSTDDLSIATIERLELDANGTPVGGWTDERPFPDARSHHAVVEHGGAIYAVAGFTRTATEAPPYWQDENHPDVLRAAVGADGSLGEWLPAGELALPLAIHAAFIHDDALYVVGGIEGPTKGGTIIGSVRRAAFRADGTLESFEDVGALPLPRGHCHHAPSYGPNVYSVGGMNIDGIHMHSEAEAFFARFE